MPQDFAITSLKSGLLNKSLEDIGGCDAVLVPDVTEIYSNITVLAAFLRLVKESSYNQYKQQYSVDFPEYFSGEYSQFDEARKEFYQKESFDLEVYEAKSILQSVVSSEKVNAWLQCVTNTGFGLYAYLNDITDDGATLKVEWVPPPGLAELKQPKLVLEQGTSKGNTFENAAQFVGAADIIIIRSVTNSWVRGTLSGIAGKDGSYSARFFLPSVPKLHTVNVDKVLSSSTQFETRYLIPVNILPVDVDLSVETTTSVTGEFFTQAPRFIQQYVWVRGDMKWDSGEVGGFGEGEMKSLSHTEVVTIPAGRQVEVRVRNNHKGAKIGSTVLRYTGSYDVLK